MFSTSEGEKMLMHCKNYGTKKAAARNSQISNYKTMTKQIIMKAFQCNNYNTIIQLLHNT
jgi:CMP-N-acetylneuraminic acid synthetase